ncbi:hypothetical protein [Fulvimarina sp. MAC3]|uniref:hypothetical protein n=1 Tax=Fulvimarina sp. MAC3 TaxID=3148887 RepID=UPI0031FC6DB0
MQDMIRRAVTGAVVAFGLIGSILGIACAQQAESPSSNTAGENAAPSGGIELELNNATDADGACRISYLASNKTQQAFERIAYDFVVFDEESRVSRLLVLDFGQLPVGKTKVVQFDLSDQQCSEISRLLINDVSECSIAGGDSALCLQGLKTSTRTDIVFGL